MPGCILETSRNVSLADKVNSRARYRRQALSSSPLFAITVMIYLPHRRTPRRVEQLRARARHGKSRTNGFNERDFRIRYKVFDLTTGFRSGSRVI